MHLCLRGLLAASAATAVAALLLWINAASGPLPALDLIDMMAKVMGASRASAWSAYVLIGVLGCGLAMAVLVDDDGGSPVVASIVLAAVGWVGTMMALLPMAGFAPFGADLSAAVPVLVALWFAAYGLALGWCYARLPALVPALLRAARPGMESGLQRAHAHPAPVDTATDVADGVVADGAAGWPTRSGAVRLAAADQPAPTTGPRFATRRAARAALLALLRRIAAPEPGASAPMAPTARILTPAAVAHAAVQPRRHAAWSHARAACGRAQFAAANFFRAVPVHLRHAAAHHLRTAARHR